MKFNNEIQKIFFDHIHRRYHRFCRELFAQFLCLNLNIKSAYLFDLFPYSIQQMRNLLNSLSIYLSFPSIILKYSLNDLIIVNTSEFKKLIDSSVFLIDLTTMTITDSHSMIDKIRDHLRWIDHQRNEQIDFDNETNEEWSNLIQSLNHTTVFGYLLGYPITYFYPLSILFDVTILKNFRLYLKIDDLKEEVLLYSFSCPIHSNIDQEHLDLIVNQWYSSLSIKIKSMKLINHFHLEKQIREESIMISLKSELSVKDPLIIISNTITKHSEPVFLNVYDLLSDYQPVHCFFNYCVCRLFGAYHTSVQIYDVEYYFGDSICKCRPHSHVGRLILSKKVGVTQMTRNEIETKILFDMYDHFTRKDCENLGFLLLLNKNLIDSIDDLLRHNCNHFTNIFLNRLLGIDLPLRFNRTERCITARPCCTRTLNCIFGKDWTRPMVRIRSFSSNEQKKASPSQKNCLKRNETFYL